MCPDSILFYHHQRTYVTNFVRIVAAYFFLASSTQYQTVIATHLESSRARSVTLMMRSGPILVKNLKPSLRSLSNLPKTNFLHSAFIVSLNRLPNDLIHLLSITGVKELVVGRSGLERKVTLTDLPVAHPDDIYHTEHNEGYR